MPATIRTGLIGYGFASKTFHAPLIEAMPGLELVAVSSSDAAKVHADRPTLTVLASPEELIARPDIALVVIPTPNDTHFPLARAALLAGKHVVVDKPFTLSVAQAQALSALATRQAVVLSVFHNRRWDGDFMTVRQLVQSGELGRVVHFESHFDRFRPQLRCRWREQPGLGSGLWYDLGPHLIDQALQLFGWPQAINVDLANLRDGSKTDDWCHAQLRYDGLRVSLHASALVAACELRFAVHGTRGSYVKHGLDTQEDSLKAGALPCWPPQHGWGTDAGYSMLTALHEDQLVARAWPLQRGHYGAYYAGLRDAILGLAPNPVTPAQAIAVMALIERGQQSAAQRRELPTPALNDLTPG
jgi:predicted dehydrogenase